MTEENKVIVSEDYKKRAELFSKELDVLITKYQIGIQPQLEPKLVIVDLKKPEDKGEVAKAVTQN